jgi:hypothetical protein
METDNTASSENESQINDSDLKLRKEYYSKTFVQFELIKCLKHRELACLERKGKKNIRFVMAFNIDYLKRHFDSLGILKRNVNLYHSVATLKDIPVFSYNLKERTKEAKYVDFNLNFKDFIIGYDLFIDFDGKEDFKRCYEEAKEIKAIFDEKKLPYYLLNSSSTGFHIIIPTEFFNQTDIFKNIEDIKEIINNLAIIYGSMTIDTSISDLKRLKKLPYSFVKDGTIALPLTDEMFNNYSLEMVKAENVLKSVMLKNRGLLIRTHGLSTEQLKENVRQFINEYKTN